MAFASATVFLFFVMGADAAFGKFHLPKANIIVQPSSGCTSWDCKAVDEENSLLCLPPGGRGTAKRWKEPAGTKAEYKPLLRPYMESIPTKSKTKRREQAPALPYCDTICKSQATESQLTVWRPGPAWEFPPAVSAGVSAGHRHNGGNRHRSAFLFCTSCNRPFRDIHHRACLLPIRSSGNSASSPHCFCF